MVERGGVSPLPTEPAEVNFRDWQARGADALVIGSDRSRCPTAASRCASACSTCRSRRSSRAYSYLVGASAAARHRAPDRRRDLREAHRRDAACSHAHRLRGEAGHALRAAGRRRRRLQRADGARLATSRSSRRPGRRTARRIAYVSFEQRKPIVYVQIAGHRAAPAWWPTSRASTARRRGRRTASSSRWCCPRTAARRST